jgi:hypothetical protein
MVAMWIGFGFGALKNAQHQREIPLQNVFGFCELLFGEVRIQIVDGWGGFRVHVVLHRSHLAAPPKDG